MNAKLKAWQEQRNSSTSKVVWPGSQNTIIAVGGGPRSRINGGNGGNGGNGMGSV